MPRVSRTVRAAVLLGDSSRYSVVLTAVLATVALAVKVPDVEWRSPSFDHASQGITTERTYTPYGEGWFSSRSRIYAMDATYTVDGVQHSVRSYSSADVPAGTPVEIEYVAADPGVARIKTMRSKPYAPWSSSIVFLAAISLLSSVIAIRWLRSARRSLALLERGSVATARVLAVDEAVVRASDVGRDTVHCELTLPDGRTVRTSIPAYGRIREDGEATVVFDPAAPEQATILSTLPGMLAATADGGVMSLRSSATIWGLVTLGILFPVAEIILMLTWMT